MKSAIEFPDDKMMLLNKNSATIETFIYEINQSAIRNVTVNMEAATIEGTGIFTTLHGYPVSVGTLLVGILMVIMGVWIIVLNCLLIHTLIKRHAQLEVTDMFIHSLAVTDALIGVLLLYNSTYNVVNFQNRYECLTRFGFIHAMLMNSTGHISLLTINRYIKIIKPFHYLQIFKKWRIVFLSGTVWCFSITIGLLPLFGWNKEYEYMQSATDDTHTVCRYFGIIQPGYIIINVLLYWIPLILMAIMYTHVCQITYRHSREIIAQERAVKKKEFRVFESRSWRFTKTVLIVIGVYFFCWLPTGIYFMVQLSGSIDYVSYEKQGTILTLTTALGFLNSLLNPIIYATKIPCVKERFLHVFCCKSKRRQSLHSMIYSTEDIMTLANRRKQLRVEV